MSKIKGLKTPSFLSEVAVADLPGESEITFEAAMKSSSSPITEIVQIVDAFVAAANVGMFSIEPTAKTNPVEAVSVESHGGGIIRYVWKVTGIQVGAFRVLLNMLEVAHTFHEPLASIRLSSTLSYGNRMDQNAVLSTPFPSKIGNPPFALHTKSNLADSREPLIRLEFQRDISDDEFVTLLPLFIAWDNIVIRGGYLEDLDDRDPGLDIEASLSSQQTYLAAPNTVEHLFYEFVGHEAAYDALVNMAIRLHQVFVPLASFEIE